MIPNFEYLNIETIPKDIILSAKEIIELPYFEYNSEFEQIRHPLAKEHYHRKKINPELKDWLLNTFNFNFTAFYIVFTTNMPPHRDLRDYTYNYIIDTGGDWVYTEFYNAQASSLDLKLWDSVRQDSNNNLFVNKKEIRLIERHLIEKEKWHRLKTKIPHGTSGTLSRPRVILSVINIEDVIFPSDPKLKSAVDDIFNNW